MEVKQHEPYVPEQTDMKEFTFKAIFIGVILSMVLGAANAYIGLRAGMTVAATFPAAVIAMAFLRIFKGNILEENVARATATVGEALVAGTADLDAAGCGRVGLFAQVEIKFHATLVGVVECVPQRPAWHRRLFGCGLGERDAAVRLLDELGIELPGVIGQTLSDGPETVEHPQAVLLLR